MKDLPGSEGTEVTWVGVSGSWRYALPGLRDAVHKEVAAALAAGKSIVTGGALGTDYWATEMALSIDPARLKVIVPTSLVTYAAHYRRRAAEGVISAQQAENLITQLEAVAQAGGLVEHPERPQVVNVTTYYLRNQDVVDVADELLAFQVNASSGTQDTVDKARLKGIPVVVFTFQAASDPPLHHASLRRLGLSPGPCVFGCLRARLGLARLRLGLLLWLSLRLALGLVCPGLGVLVLRCPRGHLVAAALKLRLGLSRDVPGARCGVRPSFVRGVVRFPAFPPGG